MASKKTEVAAPQNTAVQTQLDFAGDAGRGMEGADKASFAIPFIILLQSNSPQLDTEPNARAGMFLNSVTNELLDTVNVVPVAFQRRYLAWMPREAGGGFRGEYSVAEVEAAANPLKLTKNDRGQMVMPDGAVLKDTRNHFVLAEMGDGSWMQAIISLGSTQIKKSKRWMSRQQAIQLKDASGRTFNPPSFSHIYKCSSVTEENDKGKWKGIIIDLVGPVTSAELYQSAKNFNTLISAGAIEVTPPPSESDEAHGDAF